MSKTQEKVHHITQKAKEGLKDNPRPLCQHCQYRVITRPKQLCWTCYTNEGIRSLYPSTSKYARRGIGAGNKKVQLPTIVSDAMPGSFEKIELMHERAKRGESLFHPAEPRLKTPEAKSSEFYGVFRRMVPAHYRKTVNYRDDESVHGRG